VKDTELIQVVEDLLLPLHKTDKETLDTIDGWLRFTPEPIKTRATSNEEAKYLKSLSNTPWARVVIETTAQALKTEGIYAANHQPSELADMWAPWDKNDMETKQGALYRASLAYGLAYTLVLPGMDAFGNPGAQITAHSPRDFFAVYDDVVEDEYPSWALRIITQRGGAVHYRLIDDEAVHYLSREDASASIKFIESRKHNAGVTPVVRYANQLDLEGRAPGELQPLFPLFARINKTDYDRLLVQHFNSWKVRWATGIEESGPDADDEATKLKLRHQDILASENHEAKFGTLDETTMDPFVKAHDSDLESLAATSQTPMTTFGKIVNVSAEGLVEARSSLRAKVGDRQTGYGASNVRTLRLSAHVEGRKDDAANFSVRSKWADTEMSMLAGAVDALGKAATMLQIPFELLWDRIPGIDSTTAESWRTYAAEHPGPEAVQAKAVADALAANATVDAAAGA